MLRARLLGLPGLLLLLLPACSLMNLDELDSRPCESNLDCAKAQKKAGLDATLCGHCVEGLCDFQHRSEACNGVDDDCDGSIDEDLSGAPRQLTGTSEQLRSLAFATASVGPAVTYVVDGEARRGFVVTADGLIEQPAELRYDSEVGSREHPCPSLDQAGVIDCNFAEVAIAADSEHLVYATINTFGCGAGQVRLGLADRRGQNSPFTVWLGDPQQAKGNATSDLSVGVAARTDSCTGTGPAPAADAGPAPGARSPAVASIDTVEGGEGALAVWLSARANDEQPLTCSSTASVAVQALGVHVAPREARSLLGTDSGSPQEIGETTSLAPPAVLALSSPEGAANYLVGFASEEQGERGVRVVLVSSDKQRLDAEPLAFIPDPFADRVVLAAGGVAEDEPHVGVAWTSPCAIVPTLHFATISLSRPEQPSPPLTLEIGRLRQAPQLLHRAEGFSSSAPKGGWFLLWAEHTGRNVGDVKLARLVEDRSAPLNVVTLATGAFGYALLLPHGGDSMRHALIEIDKNSGEPLEIFADWCGVSG